MSDQTVELDKGRQEKAREYARIRRRLFVLELVLGGAYIVLWLAAGWNLALRDWLQAAGGGPLPAGLPWWATLLLYSVLLGLPWSVLTLPLRYYRGFTLPHRYDLSNQEVTGWITDRVKGLAVSAVIGAPLLMLLYGLIRTAPQTWWFWTASAYTFFSAVLTAIAPVVLMPIFYKFEPLADEHEELRRRLLDLADTAGTKVRGVFKFDMSRRTKAANAALAGLGRTRRIVLGDNLLSDFTVDEIETVLAHELGHHVHRDIPLMLLAQTIFNFVAFYLAFLGLESLAVPLSLDGAADPAGLPLLGLLFSALGLVTMPLSNAFSRWRESLADQYALQATRKPEAFASAMTRLANQNLADVDPEAWVVYLFYSHPPLRDRIGRAEAMARSQAAASD